MFPDRRCDSGSDLDQRACLDSKRPMNNDSGTIDTCDSGSCVHSPIFGGVIFNYDDYTRYVSNLNYRYLRIDRRAEVLAKIHDLGKGNRGHTLSVYVGGVGQLLTERELSVLREIAKLCITQDHDAWILMDLTLDVVFQNKVLPRAWLAQMAPLALGESGYVRDEFLFWKVDACQPLCQKCKVAQEKVVSDRYYDLLGELLHLYERGSIVGCTEQFALDWELEQDEKGIWHPTWWNALLTSGDPTLYLTREMEDGLEGTYASAAADTYRRLGAREVW